MQRKLTIYFEDDSTDEDFIPSITRGFYDTIRLQAKTYFTNVQIQFEDPTPPPSFQDFINTLKEG